MKKKSCFFGLIALLLIVSQCSKKDTETTSGNMHPLISGFTSGTISHMSSIRIQFTEDIVESAEVDKKLASSPFSFNPGIKGKAVWTSARTLEFQPDSPLKSGESYAATVKLAKFMAAEKGEETFSFKFSVIRQSMEITVDGLRSVSATDLSKQELTGLLRLADTEDSSKIVRILEAKFSGETLPISWKIQSTARDCRFTVKNIKRQDNASKLVLSWDGNAIGVDDKGKREIDVPGLSTFKALSAQAVRTGDQSIELRFSDPVDAGQNLQGLIRIPNVSNLRFSVENNIVRIYSSKRWTGEVEIQAEDGIKNVAGHRLSERASFRVHFEAVKPQVKFAGKGVIIPTSQGMTIPIEAVNLQAVIVEAIRIHDQNMPQFFQVNNYDGDREMNRVGRTVWKEVVPLDTTMEHQDEWVRYGLDVSPLVENFPGGLYRLVLTFRRQHIIYECSEPVKKEEIDLSLGNWDEDGNPEYSYWDYWDEDYDWNDYYHNRTNPCHPAYYRHYYDHDITASQNVLISNIGLIAKQGTNDTLIVAATDLRTAQPLGNTELEVLDYQEHGIAKASTDGKGMAVIAMREKPFLIIARRGNEKGYLKVADGAALSVSHFDVSGSKTEKGIKGFIYGERGVWRPGDLIYLTFILSDDGRLPANHPVTCELRDPKGQVVKRITQTESVNGFYTFQMKTDPEAPTGRWAAKIKVGGASFEKSLKIETVMPNRLKIHLDFGGEKELHAGKMTAVLSSTWLHGAIAKNLKADINMRLAPARTRFQAFSEYEFDNPARRYESDDKVIFDGVLDEKGKADVALTLPSDIRSAGMLRADFTTRVFEPGGAFSIDQTSMDFHPYDRYLGVRVPPGDKARGMLRTDTTHTVQIVAVDREGTLSEGGSAEIKLYKIDWRWWWEKGNENLADYIGRTSYRPIQCDTVKLAKGKAEWPLRLEYPQWGRFLIQVRDLAGRHTTGKIMYIDWPGWAGRARKDQPGGATVLSFSADKQEYQVGEQVVVSLPEMGQGRLLASIESGTRVLKADWIESTKGPIRYTFTATPGMAPNVYIHMTFVQPHQNAGNDLPIRMYGVTPIKVYDPKTKLEPKIDAPESFKPEAVSTVTVSEAKDREMTYTLAVVDEGLLDLTGFKTPDPWDYFFSREALGVKTWDLYDNVAGAFGGSLEKLLAIGGGDEGEGPAQQKANRFKPMVRFYGPFTLKKNKKQKHEIDIPQYVGSVRVMVVAGQNKAFGAAEKAVFVKKPLMILATLPRVLSIQEELSLPVSVFAMEDKIRDVSVSVDVKGPVQLTDANEKSLRFSEIGDQIATFKIRATKPGIASVHVKAKCGNETAEQDIEIDVRNPIKKATDVIEHSLSPGKTWKTDIDLPGMPGTNEVTLEVSTIPPLNLGRRLNYLIHYPYGCVEQTTSSVFPQIYLSKLLDLPPSRKIEIENNIKAGIDRLKNFQHSDGGFSYWPGANDTHDWCSSYAGHFLLEARNAGYSVPSGMIDPWIDYQTKTARAWTTGPKGTLLAQSYRLYTLALAGKPELGAMNRLKEVKDLPATVRWQLAVAYQLAGQSEAARELTRGPFTFFGNTYWAGTFGSDLRDKAIILEAMSLMNEQSKAKDLAVELSSALSDKRWLSTQTTAFMLVALAKHTGLTGRSQDLEFELGWNTGKMTKVGTDYPVYQQKLDVNSDTTGVLKIVNKTNVDIYPRLILQGQPRIGREMPAQNDIKIDVSYATASGQTLNVARLPQGTDLVATVTVTHIGTTRNDYENLALSHLVPSGWEIHNERITSESVQSSSLFDYQDIRDDRVNTFFDLRKGKSKTFKVMLNASYLGRFYLPPVTVEAMYDATINARTQGQWIEVVPSE